MKNLFNHKSLSESFDKNRFNIIASGWINFIGCPLYYLICTEVIIQTYDNLYIRIFSSAISIPLFFTNLYQDKFRPYLVMYWYCWMTLILPTFFSFMLFINDFSGIWLIAETIMLFIVILFIENVVGVILIVLIGTSLAYLAFYFISGRYSFQNQVAAMEFLLMLPLVFLCGMLFFRNAKRGELERQENKNLQRSLLLKSLGASIAHELRNPLGRINLIGDQINEITRNNIDDSAKEKLELLNLQITESISSANRIINIILNDLNEKPINPKEFICLKPSLIIPNVIKNYAYKNETERGRISFVDNINNDFTFKAVPDRLTFIIYNLIKNALYYLREYPNSFVIIGTEERTIEDKTWNVLYIQDTGPGIKPESISKLFNDFYTFGKKEGTGLGLSFCKRNMKAFDGDIICESEFGKWTKFSLLFPKIDQSDLGWQFKNFTNKTDNSSYQDNTLIKDQNAINYQEILPKLKSKKVLLADDQEINLIVFAKKLENLGMKVTKAIDGKELLEKYLNSMELSKSSFDIIITDINMPKMSGIEAAKKIRRLEIANNIIHKNSIPIIAITGDGIEEKTNQFLEAGIDDWFIKGSDVAKLIKILGDSF